MKATIIITWTELKEDSKHFFKSETKVLDVPQKNEVRDRILHIKNWIRKNKFNDSIGFIFSGLDTSITTSTTMSQFVKNLVESRYNVEIIFVNFKDSDLLITQRVKKFKSSIAPNQRKLPLLYKLFNIRSTGSYGDAVETLKLSTDQHYKQFEKYAMYFTKSSPEEKDNLKIYKTVVKKKS